jgi:hypothetical protein
MTHSQLPEEHKMVYDMTRRFADEELAPNAGEWDKHHTFPEAAIAQLVRSTCEDEPFVFLYVENLKMTVNRTRPNETHYSVSYRTLTTPILHYISTILYHSL